MVLSHRRRPEVVWSERVGPVPIGGFSFHSAFATGHAASVSV